MKSKPLADILSENLPVPMAIVGSGVLNAGTKCIMYGKPKTMKSIASKRLLLNVGDGKPWLGLSVPRPGVRVLYVQLEITAYELQDRMRIMSNGTKGVLASEAFIWNVKTLKLDTPQGQGDLEDEVIATKAELVIIDPVYKVVTGDMLQAVYMSPLLDYLDRLIERHGVGVMLVHHQRKGAPGKDSEADEMMGSVLFQAWPDTVMRVSRDKGVVDLLTFRFELVRHARKDIRNISTRVDGKLSLTPVVGIKE